MQTQTCHSNGKLKLAALLLLGFMLTLCAPLNATAADDVTLDEIAEVMPEMRAALDSVRLRKNPQLLDGATIKSKHLPRLLLKNVSLKGGTFKNCNLPNLMLENITLENFTFEGSSISEAVFKNVKFINCNFTGSSLTESELSDCLFKGGSFIREKYNSFDGRPDFNKNVYDRVVFDGCSFKNNFYQGNAAGSIAFKNINDPENSTHVSEGRPFIHGWGVQLDFSGCTFGKINLANAWRDSTIKFRESSLRGSSIWTGETSVSFEKCTFSGDTTLDVNGKVELIDCTAPAGVLKGYQTELKVKGGNVVMPPETSRDASN